MAQILFVFFLLIAHFALLQVFRLTTYHAYFWPSLPLLVGFAALAGATLYWLSLHEFFIWYLILESGWLYLVIRKQAKAIRPLRALYGNGAEVEDLFTISAKRTKNYFYISSAIYLAAFSWVYLWLYNLPS